MNGLEKALCNMSLARLYAKDFPCNAIVSIMSSFCSSDFLKSSYYDVTTLRVRHHVYFLCCFPDFLSTFWFGEDFLCPAPSVFFGPPQPRLISTLCSVVLRYFDRSPIFVKGQCTHCGFLAPVGPDNSGSLSLRVLGGPGWQRIQRTLRRNAKDTRKLSEKPWKNMQGWKLWLEAMSFHFDWVHICVMKLVMHIDSQRRV